MNTRLTESDYQHMIMELILQSMEHIMDLRQSGDEDMVDWIYFIERMKAKGMLSDLKPISGKGSMKSRQAAKMIRLQFDNEQLKDITTQI